MRPFDQVVADFGPLVLRVCRALLPPADAEDAWSEAFLAALRAYPQLDEGANVEAWLVTIAHRKAVDVARASARRPVAVAELPERPVEQTGSDPQLWEAVRELPTRQRHAVAYHYLAGLPYRDVAAITGGTTEAARRAAADGVRALRERYPALAEDCGR